LWDAGAVMLGKDQSGRIRHGLIQRDIGVRPVFNPWRAKNSNANLVLAVRPAARPRRRGRSVPGATGTVRRLDPPARGVTGRSD